jgi:hypothetical protein
VTDKSFRMSRAALIAAFSSDYPHAEAGRHPPERLGAALAGCNDAAQSHFYSENFARLFGIA